MGYKGRDVEIVELNEKQYLVVACDSCGAIGSKEFDLVKVDPYVVGRLTTRVALMEVLSVGAVPKALSAAVSNEPFPTSEEIISGVKDEMESILLNSVPVAISTEKNMETKQTGVGITVAGICNKEELRINKSAHGDIVYCLGIPKVGNEIQGISDSDIAKSLDISKLAKVHGINDIIPVGSRGIIKEIETLCSTLNYKFVWEPDVSVDMNKSAGPSTCLVFTCSPEIKVSFRTLTPITKIGSLELL
jgi:hypothetical protein